MSCISSVADTEQIRGYAQGLQQEYPEAQAELFVIYCFGNPAIPNEKLTLE